MHYINSFPNDNFFGLEGIQSFCDNKLNVAKIMISAFLKSRNVTEKLKTVLGRVENIVRKGENAGYQHFLLFPQSFQKTSFSGSLKVGIVW